MVYVMCAFYSIILLNSVIIGYQKKQLLSVKSFNILIILPAIYWIALLGLQYNTGTDYFEYYRLFKTGNVGLYISKKEYGFVAIVNLIKHFKLDPQFGFIFISTIQVFFFIKFLRNMSFKRIDYFLLVYFCCSTAFINQRKYDCIRRRNCEKYGNRIGRALSFVPFLSWQIKDYGFWEFMKKAFKKIWGIK